MFIILSKFLVQGFEKGTKGENEIQVIYYTCTHYTSLYLGGKTLEKKPNSINSVLL